MKQWYTIHTKPNAEYQVATFLHKRDIQIYLPEMKSPRGRQGQITKPFFPCYLFARVDFEVTGIAQVQWTPGLRRIVTFDDHPVPLSDDVISLIQSRLGASGAAGSRLATHDFRPGETVQIMHGPLQGMLAVFDGPSTPSERVQVLLSFLGQISRAQVSVAELKRVPSTPETPISRRPRRTRGRGRYININ